MNEKYSVLIVEDHPMLREGIKNLISEDPHFAIAGEIASGKNILSFLQEQQPDIIILDISLRDVNSLTLVNSIKHDYPRVKILVYTMHDKRDYVVEAFKSGVDGYLVKDSAPSVLLKGMRKVLNGQFFIDSELAMEIIEVLKKLPDKTQLINDPEYEKLSNREKEVFRLVAEGFTSKEIAVQLFISEKTVETHRSHILKKLNAGNYHELKQYAEKIGLLKSS